MSSVLKPVADRYSQKTQAEWYQFRRLLRSLVKWYGYISQVVRMIFFFFFLPYDCHLYPQKAPQTSFKVHGAFNLVYCCATA